MTSVREDANSHLSASLLSFQLLSSVILGPSYCYTETDWCVIMGPSYCYTETDWCVIMGPSYCYTETDWCYNGVCLSVCLSVYYCTLYRSLMTLIWIMSVWSLGERVGLHPFVLRTMMARCNVATPVQYISSLFISWEVFRFRGCIILPVFLYLYSVDGFYS